MDKITIQRIRALLCALGLILTFGGIVVHKEGALIIGLIISAVNLQQLQPKTTHQASDDSQ